MAGLQPYVATTVQDGVTRIVAAQHNNQETQLVALTKHALALELLPAQNVAFGSIAAGVNTEKAVFAAPSACVLVNLELVNGAALGNDPINHTRLDLVNKGSNGTGTAVIATFDGTSDSFLAFKTILRAILSGSQPVTLAQGDVLTLKKTDSGVGGAVTDLLVSVSYKPVPQ